MTLEGIATSWHSYPKVYALGHRALREAFGATVLVEEKVDGSQFSFGRFGDVLRVKSRNKELNVDEPEGMFLEGVNTAKRLAPMLQDGWTYRGEYLSKPHHNGLSYDRVPAQNFILFDVNTAEECYLGPDEKLQEAIRLGLECVPVLHRGPMLSADAIVALLDRVSVLGGATIEGVVVKDYDTLTPDKKAAIGKHVSERFKEIQKREWTKSNPSRGEFLDQLIEQYRTEARWSKAAQHLRERGEFDGSPKDIGPMIREVQADVVDECSDELAAALLKWALPQVKRKVVAGLPEWFKEQLLRGEWG